MKMNEFLDSLLEYAFEGLVFDLEKMEKNQRESFYQEVKRRTSEVLSLALKDLKEKYPERFRSINDLENEKNRLRISLLVGLILGIMICKDM